MYYDGVNTDDAYLLWKLDNWNNPTYTGIDLSGVFDATSNNGFPLSVQQITPISDGSKLFVVTTQGAFTCDVSSPLTSGSIDDIWQTSDYNSSIILLNGGNEASDGSLYAMGGFWDLGVNYELINGVQTIWQLNPGGGVPVEVSSLPSPHNDFSNGQYSSDSDFASMLGLYSWGDTIMSVKTQSSPYAQNGGTILTMNNSWSLMGAPVDNSYDYLVPIGVLPDNRFYIVNEENPSGSSVNKGIFRMDSPSGAASAVKTFLTNPSGGNKSMFYSSGISGV
ncbi:MAG: hypothetical protein PF450_10825 [Bacteroidales bacterium]|jgi:hypothetical protein|nr:hypothetical protein [Bacteroidales bacterium]